MLRMDLLAFTSKRRNSLLSASELRKHELYKTDIKNRINTWRLSYPDKGSGVARIFFGGGCPVHLKAITCPPQGSGGRSPPPVGSEVSFFQTIQSIRKWIEFSKISTFYLPKNLFFLRKISKNWKYLTGICEFFWNNYLKAT